MTRLQTLENRLEKLTEVKDIYLKGIKNGGIIKANPKSGKYTKVVMSLKKEIRNIQD